MAFAEGEIITLTTEYCPLITLFLQTDLFKYDDFHSVSHVSGEQIRVLITN